MTPELGRKLAKVVSTYNSVRTSLSEAERKRILKLSKAERKHMLKKRYQSTEDKESRAVTFKEVHGFDPDDLE
jgi:hypothetical protein